MSYALIKIKINPRLHCKNYLTLWGIGVGGRDGIGVAAQQPSSVTTIMSERYILDFVFFVACNSDIIQTNTLF